MLFKKGILFFFGKEILVLILDFSQFFLITSKHCRPNIIFIYTQAWLEKDIDIKIFGGASVINKATPSSLY